MHMQIAAVLGLIALPIFAGQPPVPKKQVPPATENLPPLLQQYDFGGQLRTLEDPSNLSKDLAHRQRRPMALAERYRRIIIRSRIYLSHRLRSKPSVLARAGKVRKMRHRRVPMVA